MEKPKKIKIFLIALSVFFVVLLFVAGYKNVKDHHDKEYLVVYNKIKEAAKTCYLKGDCDGKIKLKDLYDKNYLAKQIDPVTKEDMSEDICLEYVNKEVKLCN